MDKYIRLIDSVINEATFEYDTTKLQPALMTLSEYLSHRNPSGKMHSNTAYQATIDSLNQSSIVNSLRRDGGIIPFASTYVSVWTNNSGGKDLFAVVRKHDDPHMIYAFIKENVLYYDPMRIPKDKASMYLNADYHELEVQPIKYLEQFYKKMTIGKRKTLYGKLLKRIKIDDEYIEFRKREDEFGDLAAFNEDDLIISIGQDEWGAVLVTVAEEYRGKGIGQIMQKLYTEMYPNKESGGFTPSGLHNARKVWEREVGQFLSSGIYSNLVRKGQLKQSRVDDILSGVSGNVNVQSFLPTKPVPQKQKHYLVYFNGSNSYVLYDREYLLEQDQKYIYAYLHIGVNTKKENYVYRFEYEADKDRHLLLYMAVQELDDSNEFLVAESQGSDYYKFDDMKHLSVDSEGNFVLERKMFSNLNMIYGKEKQLRRQIDKYNEILYTLLEDAESKWR